MQRIVANVESGEVVAVDMTPAEVAQRAEDEAALAAAEQAAHDAEAQRVADLQAVLNSPIVTGATPEQKAAFARLLGLPAES